MLLESIYARGAIYSVLSNYQNIHTCKQINKWLNHERVSTSPHFVRLLTWTLATLKINKKETYVKMKRDIYLYRIVTSNQNTSRKRVMTILNISNMNTHDVQCLDVDYATNWSGYAACNKIDILRTYFLIIMGFSKI